MIILSIYNYHTTWSHYRILSALQRLELCLCDKSCWPTPALIRGQTDIAFASLFFPTALSFSSFCFDVYPWLTKSTRPSKPWSHTALEEARWRGLLPQLHHSALCNLSLGYHVTPHAGGSERYVSAAHALKCYNVYTRVNNHRNSLLMPKHPAISCFSCDECTYRRVRVNYINKQYGLSPNFPGVEKMMITVLPARNNLDYCVERFCDVLS